MSSVPTVTEALAPYTTPAKANRASCLGARVLIAAAGSLHPERLTIASIATLNLWARSGGTPSTRYSRGAGAREILKYLTMEYKAKNLARHIDRLRVATPRNVTATQAERDALISKAPPHIRCWLLFCSDLAIRSGTASRITPQAFDKEAGTITFTTKNGAKQKTQVTAELRALMSQAIRPNVPYASQIGRNREPGTRGAILSANTLNRNFRALKARCGIERDLRPHDLRRTTARRVYKQTQDLRQVQALLGHSSLGSTLWYLQDALVQVEASTLELAKLAPITERTQ